MMRQNRHDFLDPVSAPSLDLLRHLEMEHGAGRREQALIECVAHQRMLEEVAAGLLVTMYEVECGGGGEGSGGIGLCDGS